ncbi:hypothetical protein [Undibacterium sp. SXout20W]|uniref:hypothetical protein n=1 Tax=Undibacterium sp. SXout20W TaxID=3413051 RepID=UPI003BF07A30
MAIGSIQTVVVCSASQISTISQQVICPNVGGQYFVPTTVQTYLLDPSQQLNFEGAIAPFDYAYASGIWTLAFSTVVGLWLLSHSIGIVLAHLRRG